MKKANKIAEKVGYQDANYFSYVFKKEIRCFPFQIQSFRKIKRRKAERASTERLREYIRQKRGNR